MALAAGAAALQPGDRGYEQARQDAIWNAYKPERYPAAIVLAHTAQDVAEAVRYAVDRGLRVKPAREATAGRRRACATGRC